MGFGKGVYCKRNRFWNVSRTCTVFTFHDYEGIDPEYRGQTLIIEFDGRSRPYIDGKRVTGKEEKLIKQNFRIR